MRRGFLPAIVIVALAVLAPAAGASGPRWTQGQPLAHDVTAQALGAGVDAAGNVTTLSVEGGRLVGRLRRPGGAMSAVDLGSAPSPPPVAIRPPAKLAVADGGEVVVVHTNRLCGGPGPEKCTEPVYVRVGPSIAELSPPHLLTDDGPNPSVTISARGHVLVGWRGSDESVHAAWREPGGGLAFQRQMLRGPSGREYGVAAPLYVSASTSDRGHAAIAWQDSERGPTGYSQSRGAVAFKEPGQGFGPANDIGLLDSIGLGVGEDGLQVAVDATGSAVLSMAGYDPSFTWRPPGGAIAPRASFRVGRGASRVSLVGRPEAQVALFWITFDGPGAKKIAVRSAGGGFGPLRALPFAGPEQPALGTDARGNLHLAFMEGYVGPMRAATLSRLDLKPSEVTGPLGPPTRSIGSSYTQRHLSVNARGQAALLWSGRTDDDPRQVLFLAERPPDTTAPDLGIRLATARRGVLRARPRCSEACRARAEVVVTRVRRSKKRAKASIRSATQWTTAQPGARPLMTTRLRPSERRRLRALVKKRRRLTAVVTVTAEDGSGNRRVVRRRIPVKRLLR